ncbi:MAG: hypothetical protein KKA31_02535 [Candidatus Margulisbacteria bacterium]|nr:hypothetical protein [Candidatus Margulisiibacteriota bacterium]
MGQAWFSLSKALHLQSPSLRQTFGLRKAQPTVIAIGGNSFKGLERATAKNIIAMIKAGCSPIITHGNGPQVGELLIKHPDKTLAQCVAMTQEQMGAALKTQLETLASRENIALEVAVIPTRVIVDKNDPAFKNPTKYIGPRYTLDQLSQMGKLSKTPQEIGRFTLRKDDGQEWAIKEVAGEKGQYRRVVASPKPLAIHPEDLSRIKDAMAQAKLVIGVGGGGVAVSQNNQLEEAVIDKDLASAVLSWTLKARDFIISTGVPQVCLDWGTAAPQNITYFQTRQAQRKLFGGQFPAGSMGEKIEATIAALRVGVNTVLITHPSSAWVKNEGTIFTRGIDLTGRAFNFARRLGLVPNEIQRWLVT